MIAGPPTTGLAVVLVPFDNRLRLDRACSRLLLQVNTHPFDQFLLNFGRYYYPGAATQRCLFPIRTPSILASLLVALLATLLSLVAGISHLLHLLTLHSAECSWEQPAPVLESWPQSSCLCISATSLWQEGHLLYPGLACPQVKYRNYCCSQFFDTFPGAFLASPSSPLPLTGQLALEHRLPRLHAPPLLLHAQPHLQAVEGGQEGVDHRARLSDSNVAQEPLIADQEHK